MNKTSFGIMLFAIIGIIFPTTAFAEEIDPEELFDTAINEFDKGNYKTAITNFEKILEVLPNHPQVLRYHGIANSNLELHKESMMSFYKVLYDDPEDVIALNGLGLGFGNFGEYEESLNYFEQSLSVEPGNHITQNYIEIVEKIIKKYPYTPTEKPTPIVVNKVTKIPDWIKNNASWWAEGQIGDSDFVSGIEYLISNKIIEISSIRSGESASDSIPVWIKTNAGWWADGQISDEDFVKGIQYMIENGIMYVDTTSINIVNEQKEADLKTFKRYLDTISRNVSNEKRYIEFPNPSFDVIKKFLRDYQKWNFEQQIEFGNTNFPDPIVTSDGDTVIVNYKMFVNEQPTGLPLDHVSTLDDSIAFWEEQVFTSNQGNAKVKIEYTESKVDANLWVTWVVRSLGEGVLGHAHLGKGAVEVALGDYNCDGSFQLYDVATVEKIMTHEIGHGIGLLHTDDPSNIMYPSATTNHAYCLLS